MYKMISETFRPPIRPFPKIGLVIHKPTKRVGSNTAAPMGTSNSIKTEIDVWARATCHLVVLFNLTNMITWNTYFAKNHLFNLVLLSKIVVLTRQAESVFQISPYFV